LSLPSPIKTALTDSHLLYIQTTFVLQSSNRHSIHQFANYSRSGQELRTSKQINCKIPVVLTLLFHQHEIHA